MKKKIFILMVAFFVFLTGCSGKKEENNTEKEETKIVVEKISVDEVKKIIDDYINYPDIDIVDVRTEEEFAEGHIEGAINIPLNHIEEINISTDRQIIVYCQSGSRSNQAAKTLIQLGYNDVKDMGGLDDWTYDLVED